MNTTPQTDQPLAGRRIAVPESRELNLFSQMLVQRGAEVLRCPLVSIHDSPNQHDVEDWLRDFSAGQYQDLILLTGEGLRRLNGFAERAGGSLRDDFIAALEKVRKITRGPKPGTALRKLGLKTDLIAVAPTTEGVIETLKSEDLNGRVIGVQLYGDNPNTPLTEFLTAKGAQVRTVAPYVYADDAELAQVESLIRSLIRDEVDAMAFTSTPQIKRLLKVARQGGNEAELRLALSKICVAAVGPVMAEALEAEGISVSLMPESSYFMKPLVRKLVSVFSA